LVGSKDKRGKEKGIRLKAKGNNKKLTVCHNVENFDGIVKNKAEKTKNEKTLNSRL
jgi:hypothetical protein